MSRNEWNTTGLQSWEVRTLFPPRRAATAQCLAAAADATLQLAATTKADEEDLRAIADGMAVAARAAAKRDGGDGATLPPLHPGEPELFAKLKAPPPHRALEAAPAADAPAADAPAAAAPAAPAPAAPATPVAADGEWPPPPRSSPDELWARGAPAAAEGAARRSPLFDDPLFEEEEEKEEDAAAAPPPPPPLFAADAGPAVVAAVVAPPPPPPAPAPREPAADVADEASDAASAAGSVDPWWWVARVGDAGRARRHVAAAAAQRRAEIKSSTRLQCEHLCFENSTKAIDSSKSQPNRLRSDRAREF